MADAAIDALGNSEEVYQRGGLLVQVVNDAEPPPGIKRPADAPRIVVIRNARLRELLTEVAAFAVPGDKGELKPIHPPGWVISAIVARGEWNNLRRLEAVTETPLLRADGTILQEPGYDAATGIMYQPYCNYPPIPEEPQQANVKST